MLLFHALPGKCIESGEDLVKACSKFILYHANQVNKQHLSPTDFVEIKECMGFVPTLSNAHTFVTMMENWGSIKNHLNRFEREENKVLKDPASLVAIRIFTYEFPCRKG